MKLKFMSKEMTLFFFYVFLYCLAANFAHPITPTLIKNLNLASSTFGTAFAGMAFTNFLFSPFWGKISRFTGTKYALGICHIGYGIGQFLFSQATSEMGIVLARMCSGFFIGGITVNYLVYILNHSDDRQRNTNLTIYATMTTVVGAFGYLIGGLLGEISLSLTFNIQVISLISIGVFIMLSAKDDRYHEKVSVPQLIRDANPFKSFLDARSFMTPLLVILFVSVLCTSLSSTAYEQCFNYFIKDQFGFTSSYNGILKALVGFISLIANATICMWLINKTNVKRSLVYVLACCAFTMTGVACFNDMIPFIIINVIFFAFNAIYIPLQQSVVSDSSTSENNGLVMGFFNAVKSLGMIGGSLIAGFIYEMGANLSFLFACVFFIIAAVLSYIYAKRA